MIEFDSSNNVVNIVEKPKKTVSNYAVTGLYIYNNEVINVAKNIKPSSRGELEITDVNNAYIQKKKMNVTILDKEFTWLDTGTHESLLEACQFVHTVEKLQGIKLACIEETALSKGWIRSSEVKCGLHKFQNSSYSKYLLKVINKYENN